MAKKYYLNATFATKTSEEVWQRATDFQLYFRSNADAPDQILSCNEKLLIAHAQITTAIGADSDDYLYTTSSHYQNIFSIFHAIYQNFIYPTGKNIVLISPFDKQTERVLQSFISLGCVIKKIVPNPKGQITRQEIENAISPKTAFVSLPFADPVTGIIYPIWDIGEYCRQMGIFFHVEISHILGQMIFPFSSLPVDFVSFDGRYVEGLSGIAATFVKKEVNLSGVWKERNRPDAPGLFIALGFALQALSQAKETACLEIARHKAIFEKQLTDTIPTAQLLFSSIEQLSNTVVIAFPGLHQEALLYFLQEIQIIASIGDPNYASLATILSTCPELAHMAHHSIHCSFTLREKEEDFQEIVQRIARTVQSLQTITGVL